jgi:ribosome-associated protein
MPTVKSTDADLDTDSDVAVPGAMGQISKTQLKKASHDLQELGEALVALPDDRLNALPIAESLLDAVREFKRTRSHEGRRRQMQYIGKLMRRTDAEPIREAVAGMQLGSAKDTLALHQAEGWRVELISDDAALTRWMAEHPKTDVQQLRSLLRNARKDAALAPEQRSGRAFRELFQFIKQSTQQSTQLRAGADNDV